MRLQGLLESLSDPDEEVVFSTNVFKHGLQLPWRHLAWEFRENRLQRARLQNLRVPILRALRKWGL
ncbi:unnamed protein product [Prunus armeniaca]|uniref:Uncharacterized protein n=1 Tax=Prunus armeniaca TaxID=36596 RepID=A0A6J5TXF9_PRUAR|nr:unnamed protein product [Prunus armeniaca]CAB4298827.1 unnamed protein product [Prunus armeniaca]